MRAVIDSNVAVSATISPLGASARIVRDWRARKFTWVVSEAQLVELGRALRYPRVLRRSAWTEEDRRSFVEELRRVAVLVTPQTKVNILRRDPDDNMLLEAAVTGSADYVVSGDAQLLAVGVFEGASIVTPARFVAILASDAF